MCTRVLAQCSEPVTVQWVPSHVGILENEQADKLAKDAHKLQLSIHCPTSSNRPYSDVTAVFEEVVDPDR